MGSSPPSPHKATLGHNHNSLNPNPQGQASSKQSPSLLDHLFDIRQVTPFL